MKTLNFVALYVTSEWWIVSKGYRLYKYWPETGYKELFGVVKDKKNALASRFSLLRRLLRAEITHLYRFRNDNWMCIGRKALFRLNSATGTFEKCCDIEKGSRPLSLCQASDGTIYYGEYCFNPERKPMRVFQSNDDGNTWSVAYTFADGEINHIHGIFADPHCPGRLWVATGDNDCACIFGYTDDGFKTFIKKYAGRQQYRVCVPLFRETDIIYATDSQYEQNYIRSIDRESGAVTDLQPIQGSGIYSAQFGPWLTVSTTVEPSDKNTIRRSFLWLSRDGREWKEVASFAKDALPLVYFQFGSIRFPAYEGASNKLIFTGRALRGLDGKTAVIDLK